ncbi:MAG: hypothetical protein IPI68_04605 [Chitinophagaceae bacterium]|nr:hypothetical protein [Chitinophagaceae bacterium]
MPYAKALCSSLKEYGNGRLEIMVIDNNNLIASDNYAIYHLQDIENDKLFSEIQKKYAHTNADHFRWSLKPVFISFLLKKGFEKVIYVDPDMFFVSDYSFLFQQLDSASVILTPHWRNADPLANEDNFISLFKDGLYNAGFIGASQKGLKAILWWAEVCHYKMERNLVKGFFDDQRYLDVMPVMFESTEIVRHQGCNLSYWNMTTCKREIVNGQVMINKLFEPVFIHFTKETVLNISNRNDYLLKPFLDKYEKALKAEGVELNNLWKDFNRAKYKTLFYKTKHAIRLRTRIKRFLFLIAEKF